MRDRGLVRTGNRSFGQVIQVCKKDTKRIYAMKVMNKKTIVEKNDTEHIKAERRILQKVRHPFLMTLHLSFQTPDKLYLVMDFVNGGELFTHMQAVENFDEPRTRFYGQWLGVRTSCACHCWRVM
jgi:serine/threonine protein kinase